MAKIRRLYSFDLENGDSKESFVIARPGVLVREGAELFYGEKLSEAIRRGFLTDAQLEKRYLNDDGIFSEPDKKQWQELIKKFAKVQEQLSIIEADETLSKEEREKKRDPLVVESTEIMRALNKFNNVRDAVYRNTAESYAKDKMSLWWVLNLSYKLNKDNEEEPFFSGQSYEEKLNSYDELEEKEDEYINKCIRYFTYYVSGWLFGNLSKEEEFKQLKSLIEEQERVYEESKANDKPEEKAEEKAEEKVEENKPVNQVDLPQKESKKRAEKDLEKKPLEQNEK